MKELIIVGAGGCGREVLQWAKDINRVSKQWIIKGFIDDNLNALDKVNCSHQVIGTIRDWAPSNEEVFACGLGSPAIKLAVIELLKNKGAIFTSIIHSSSIIADNAIIGEGVVIYPNAFISCNTKIGSFVTLLMSAVGHDAVIGDYATISAFCDITGYVNVGKSVFMGSHVTIIPNMVVGDGAYLGAGSVVVTPIKPNIKVMGNPARKMMI